LIKFLLKMPIDEKVKGKISSKSSKIYNKAIPLTKEELDVLRNEDWSSVNKFLKEVHDWKKYAVNPKAKMPLRNYLI